MQTRSRQRIAHFSKPFRLGGFDAPLPAGEYDVVEDEELIEGLSWIAYRRVATFIHLPARNAGKRQRQVIPIDHADLETALQRDRGDVAVRDSP